jgi:AbrB family looped-hinge helix DNA binding protein
MTVGTKGQVVIPVEFRRELGLEPGQRVAVDLEDGRLILRPIPRDLLEKLHGCLAEGPSLTEALAREHAEELRRDEERLRRSAAKPKAAPAERPSGER